MTAPPPDLRPGDRSTITVAGDRPYDVVVGPGVRQELALLPQTVLAGATRAAVVHTASTAALAGEAVALLQSSGLAAEAVVVPDGEAAKTAEVAAGLWTELGRLGHTRTDAVVGVGGGAVTDLAGFVAATWLRGVRVVQVPTSLLGMVDAAVGGKTGINTEAGKNLVGAFHPPVAVLVDTDTLDGLPDPEFRSGLAEVVKCGFIADDAILDLLAADPTGRRATTELITRAIQVKADAVGEDLYDTGRREFLNYGHTLGHAIEKAEDFGWRHGEAVAVGLVFAAELGVAAGRLPRADADRHRELVGAMGLPVSYAGDFDRLRAAMAVDKKSRGAALRFVVLDGLGAPGILTDPDEAWLRTAWAAVEATP
ncbi:3-dehydroquinate synthase [Klenkia terrae]|uniref:3-dehydroquinate synthase n=1 Tax=Klenkia terrae TaxID=1052259 RepID=A0ABU8E4J1_9ACTN|nr:3-dehydroquinate synthase [Klenkia terrae]